MLLSLAPVFYRRHMLLKGRLTVSTDVILNGCFMFNYAFERNTSSGGLFKIPRLLSRPMITVKKVIAKNMAKQPAIG
jgi:hypothetical protein